MAEGFKSVDTKLNTILDEVGEAVLEHDKKLEKYDTRITKLEHRLA
jgi:hypothetical protein